MSRDLNKIKGALFGFAIGDALGAPYEFMPAFEQQGYLEYTGGGVCNWLPGECTDDTDLVIATAEALLDHRDTFARACMMKYSNWLIQNPKDVGVQCSKMFTMYPRFNYEPAQVVQHVVVNENNALGNGSLMRCLVPCLLEQEELAFTQSILSHSNMCLDYIRDYYKLIQCNTTDDLKQALSTLYEDAKYQANYQDNGGYIRDTMCSILDALSNFLHTQDMILTLSWTIAKGNDSDTVAALVGGILGKIVGYNSIPNTYKFGLQEKYQSKLLEIFEKIVDFEKD